ncbi:gp53-like domain-containing protein [Pantoea stewartii]|uniref:gp53-like domain-containing protein n=1 Tax=Pantoea stewartii TaxID=66269 RepID=UPI0007375AE6|nr:hypothetical protein [Pantoea stewartii]
MLKIGDLTPTATADGHWTDGNVAGGVAPTRMMAGWFNAVQDELVNVLTAAGLQTDAKNSAQILAALNKLFLQSGNNLSEISSAGSKAVASALANLGIGPVGTQVDLLAGTAKKLIDASVLSAVMPSGDVSPAGKVTIPLLINGAITTFYVMWGQTPASTDSGDTVWTVNFPYSFPTVFLSAQVSLRYPGSIDGNCAVYFYNESKSGMTIRQDKYTSVTAGFIAHWLAVGY